MNPVVKELWINALKSGEYKQGVGSLREGDEFCCLGVLCELAVKEGVISEATPGFNNYYYYDDEPYLLPTLVMKWAKLSDEAGAFIPGDLIGIASDCSLPDLNDGGYTFEQIADAIDKAL